ncbi:hypothetical protein GCM10010406_37360 [Streptomyces thermolineatus]|uniref:Uncharacterized protein n=1 Tax=Streptomyces thermolineatus TaxID=44033 RepID=A0ABP5ZM54_9ACTN
MISGASSATAALSSPAGEDTVTSYRPGSPPISMTKSLWLPIPDTCPWPFSVPLRRLRGRSPRPPHDTPGLPFRKTGSFE